MPRLRPYLRRATRQSAGGLPPGDALGARARRLDLPRLLGARQAGLRAAAALTLALVAACTAVKLGYNKLDWIAQWQIGRLVDLDPPQKQLLDSRFREVWGWHRATQLKLYVADLRELAATTDRALTAPQVQAYMERGRAHMARTLQEAVPDTAQLLQSLDDAQVRELVDHLAERRRDAREENEDLSAAQLVERSTDTMLKQLKRWIGSPTREQKQRVRAWAEARRYNGTMFGQYQEAWGAAFTEALAHRREPDFASRLSALFAGGRVPGSAAFERQQEHNRKQLAALLSDLSATLTPEQRQHFRQRLLELASDLDELAAQSASAAR
jgi:hypothetical protein